MMVKDPDGFAKVDGCRQPALKGLLCQVSRIGMPLRKRKLTLPPAILAWSYYNIGMIYLTYLARLPRAHTNGTSTIVTHRPDHKT